MRRLVCGLVLVVCLAAPAQAFTVHGAVVKGAKAVAKESVRIFYKSDAYRAGKAVVKGVGKGAKGVGKGVVYVVKHA